MEKLSMFLKRFLIQTTPPHKLDERVMKFFLAYCLGGTIQFFSPSFPTSVFHVVRLFMEKLSMFLKRFLIQPTPPHKLDERVMKFFLAYCLVSTENRLIFSPSFLTSVFTLSMNAPAFYSRSFFPNKPC